MLCPCCDDKRKVVARCEDCNDFLCILCFHAHKRVKLAKQHKITTFISLSPRLSISKEVNENIKPIKVKKAPKTEKLKMLPNTARSLKSDKKCKRYMGISLSLFK